MKLITALTFSTITFSTATFCTAEEAVKAEAPAAAKAENGFKPLFNGKTLEGWTAARSKGEGDTGAFSVNEKEQSIHAYAGEKADSEQITDCLVSNEQYSHYILKLEYKWLDKRFAPRTDWDRDAGLLFHVHGDLTQVWPLSLEMQIGESPGDKKHGKGNQGRFHTGDLFVLGKGLRVDSKRNEDRYWNPNGKKTTGKSGPTKLGVEKPHGEWNQMEIHVHGSEKATFIFNGEVVYEITNFTQMKDGKKVPLDKGHIALQAEWAEICYRNILIKVLPENNK